MSAWSTLLIIEMIGYFLAICELLKLTSKIELFLDKLQYWSDENSGILCWLFAMMTASGMFACFVALPASELPEDMSPSWYLWKFNYYGYIATYWFPWLPNNFFVALLAWALIICVGAVASLLIAVVMLPLVGLVLELLKGFVHFLDCHPNGMVGSIGLIITALPRLVG